MAKNKKSRRGKKNQRKNTDISDVEALLEKEREDALKGGPVEQRKDEALFFVDKGSETSGLDSKSRREFWKNKQSKADKILAPNPNTPTVGSTKQRALTGPTVFEQKRIEKAAKAYLNRSDKKQDSGVNDIWDVSLDPKAPNEYLEHTVTRPVKRPKIARPSVVASVEVAGPGASYRPSYEDHQDELGAAVAQELQRQAESEKRRRRYESLTVGPRHAKPDPEDDMFQEPIEVKAEPGIVIKEESDDKPDKVAVHQDFIDRKTRADRNREKRQQRTSAAARRKRARAYQRADIDNVKGIIAEIEQKEQSDAARQEFSEYKKELHAAKPKKLGRHKYVEDARPVLLTEELPKQLHSLKDVSNPLRDRFKSLQRRNLIEVRPKAIKRGRKFKLVHYEKKNL
eukprot:TRINITY_DN8338_c0_g1_i1.p1 TRINITY_DN8338_c0_g1~~TRINITY_DN8338_c0_g1_i1.p1  ORF type:complete len:399 (-),score=94.35 TRINITY_DN8338_c0_g1_i1:175-1371(-)